MKKISSDAFILKGTIDVDVNKAVSQLKKVDGEVDKSGGALDRFTGKLGGIAKGIVAAFSVKAVVDFGKKCVSLASDLEEVQNVVDVTFGEGAETVNKWAKSAATAFGMSELDAKKFNGTMGAMLKSMGLNEEATLDMSTSMVGLAGDMASFYNLDHQTAFDKIRAGISGETEPLKQLGINMSVANLEAYALAQGISKPYKEMSQSEQTMLRYNYLMSTTADAQGDFARTSDSFANQTRIAKLNLQNLSASIGELLLPAITSIVSKFNEVITKVMEFGGKIKEGFGVFQTSLQETGSFGAAFGEMFKTMFGLELPASAMTMVNSIIAFFAQLWTIVTEIWNTVAVPLIEGIKQVFSGLSDNSENVFSSISNFFQFAIDYIKTVWETLGRPVMDLIMQVIGWVRDAFAERMPQIQAFFSGAIQDIVGIWNNNLKPCFEAIGNFINNVLAPAFKFVFQNIILPVVDACFSGISKLWTNSLKPIFQGIIDFITGVFSGNWSKAWQGIVDALGGVFSGIVEVVKAPINAVIGVINKAINGLNSISVTIPDWVPFVGGNSFGVNIPNMNYLENGGILTQPTLLNSNVMAGEKNKGKSSQNEVVVPLDKLEDWIKEVAMRPVQLLINGQVMASATANDFDRENGTRLSLAGRGVLV